MQWLINRALEGFLRDSYGDPLWRKVAVLAGIDPLGFIGASSDTDRAARRVVCGAARQLRKPMSELLQDLGHWLVRREAIRRLARFSGTDFSELIHSLNELHSRAQLILPDLRFPLITVDRLEPGWYRLGTAGMPAGWNHVLAGALRGMADDYGTLALLEVENSYIELQIALERHGSVTPFHLLNLERRAALS